MPDSYRFIDEYSSRDMLHIRIVRADIPRGSISSTESTNLPDEVLVFDSDDIQGSNRVSVLEEEMPLLSDGSIAYEGEPILLIAAEEQDLLDEAERHIRISYETDFSLLAFEPASKEQIVDSVSISRGNPSKEFEETTQIVEAEYRTAIESHVSRAPSGAYTEYKDGRYCVYTPSHWPFHVRRTVADVLGIAETEIKVIQTNPSPAYGEKVVYPSILSAMSALVCQATGKAARLLLAPKEAEQFTTRKAPVHVKSTSILNEAGSIIAHDVHMRFDVGAYPLFTKELLRRAVITSGSYYQVPNVSITAEAIRTSAPPMNIYRGLGVSQSLFATEVHFSRLAEFSQLNPGDWKKSQTKDKHIVTGVHIPNMPLEKLVDTVIDQSDFYRKHSAYEQIRKRRNSVKASRRFLRGIGIATGFAGNGFTDKPVSGGNWGIKATLDKKDQLTIECGTMTIPEAIKTIWKRRAGETLGIS
ncbi:MAG: xanthine dehydrogenase family protein molybdopterin-binding subunit, partial [Spirochaetota bacterium]